MSIRLHVPEPAVCRLTAGEGRPYAVKDALGMVQNICHPALDQGLGMLAKWFHVSPSDDCAVRFCGLRGESHVHSIAVRDVLITLLGRKEGNEVARIFGAEGEEIQVDDLSKGLVHLVLGPPFYPVGCSIALVTQEMVTRK